ncbi:MAG: prepilin peptidase [Planctomycetes bacterium]|nr:prepilin peptidase [Planctomycetota bacterium]
MLAEAGFYALVLFPFGLAVGSFLNVVIYRLPRGLSLVTPGSSCPECGRLIRAVENIPLLSWLRQKGRCKGCGGLIHWRYPVVELLTGLLWSAVGYALAVEPLASAISIFTLLVSLWFVSNLVAIAFIDLDLTIIPDELNYSGLILALVASAFLPFMHPGCTAWFPAVAPQLNRFLASAIGALVGAGSMLVILLIGTLVFRKRIRKLQEKDPEIDTAIGFGDVKLMAFLGAFLGWQGGLLAFFIGTIFGAVVGLIVKLKTGQSLIPYGPFLCVGAIAVFFFRVPLLAFLAERFSILL